MSLRFRFQGPKPPIKKTAIVMIAEAIEAQANSIKKSKALRKFDAMIEKSIKDLLQDGQLDYCPLTLDDLRKIKRHR
jgi:Predicted membrane-associated HD superfamily hydrolase